jgi:uncharacterized protein YijF (DUF1287 family)
MKRKLFLALVMSIGFTKAYPQDFTSRFCYAAVALTKQKVAYDPSYYRIPYPGGDVPQNKGVCTDVVIRAYRALSIDLQKLVHEDMKNNFSEYPKNWGLRTTDRNIDHRRVPNLMTFFARHGKSLAISREPNHYQPGDIVTWDLGGNVPHIGIVIDKKSDDNKRPLIVHNIGAGQEISDCLLNHRITGHYRYENIN